MTYLEEEVASEYREGVRVQLHSCELAAVSSCQLEWACLNLTAPKHLCIQACPNGGHIDPLAANLAHALVNLVYPMVANLAHPSIANLACLDASRQMFLILEDHLLGCTTRSFGRCLEAAGPSRHMYCACLVCIILQAGLIGLCSHS